jgi:hypothetical protein
MILKTLVLLFGLTIVMQAGLLRRDFDFSNYDVPLYTQIVDRIKAWVESPFETNL